MNEPSARIGLRRYVALVEGWLKAVRKHDGYLTDLGTAIAIERQSRSGGEPHLDAAVYFDGLQSVKKTSQRRDWSFQLHVEVRVPTRMKDSEGISTDVLEDVVRAIPTKTQDVEDGLLTLEVIEADVARQPDGVEYNVVGVSLRGTCFEYTHPA